MFRRQRKTISEELVVSHCSPTMAGLKTGSLFSCPAEESAMLAEDIRYPPEDVDAFMENGVAGAKCTGMWKVYGDVDTAQMDSFDEVAFGCPSMGSEQLEKSEFEPMFSSCKALGAALAGV